MSATQRDAPYSSEAITLETPNGAEPYSSFVLFSARLVTLLHVNMLPVRSSRFRSHRVEGDWPKVTYDVMRHSGLR